MDGWKRLPRSLRFALGMWGAQVWLRLFFVFWRGDDSGALDDLLEQVTTASSFAVTVMALTGTIELARRSVHDASGLWVAVVGTAGRLAIFFGFYGIQVLRMLGKDSELLVSLSDKLRWIGLAIAIVHAIGWSIAAKDALVAVGLLLAAALGHESWRVVRWVFDDLSFTHAMEIDSLAQLAQLAMLVIGAATAGKKVQTIHLPQSPAAGLARMSFGLWMRFASALVLGGLLMYSLRHDLSSQRAFSGVLLAYLCAIGSSLVYAHGCLAACRVPDDGVPAWWTTAAAACSVMAAGVLVRQLPWVVSSAISTQDYGMWPHEEPAARFGDGSTLIAVLGGMSIVLGLAGLSGYAGRRGSLVAGSLAGAAITVTVLICLAAGVIWYLPRVETTGRAADLLVFSALLALSATVVAGLWIGKAKMALSHDPGVPAAIVIHRTMPPK